MEGKLYFMPLPKDAPLRDKVIVFLCDWALVAIPRLAAPLTLGATFLVVYGVKWLVEWFRG